MEFTFGSFKTVLYIAEGKGLAGQLPEENILRVYDEVTERLFAGGMVSGGKDSGGHDNKVVIPEGEKAKNWDTAEKILRSAVKAGLGRDGYIAGIGGGMLCDLAAFAASTYMRGCRLILVPTTLLAMVDAAVGGKTGFNFMGLKNMVGTFYPAGEVYLFPETLETLPQREFLCGIAETIKHACLGDESLFELLENEREKIVDRRKGTLMEIVKRSVLVKCRVVEQDPLEGGGRMFLNLGHTFGHALESVLGFSESRHGEAVAWGMVQAMELGRRLGLTDPEYAGRVKDIVKAYGFRLAYAIPVEQFLEAAAGDKKKREGMVRFILQRRLGETVSRPVDEKLLREVLDSQ